ncbi:unnamed protein product [Moneuplotes crassus]|uniref:Uncharacterized protein n=1 Tax=Euplotes crassus TaxID=5936 RepID=A0AAD1XTY6_EUPCR|nr:unnamed protein product [Moneuplotes crassus]
MFNLNGKCPKGLNPLAKKFILPAMVATSVAYMQYSSMMDAKTQKKAALKMLAKIPMEVKDLHRFNNFEINAITRRNTIKNKLVGRKMVKIEPQPKIERNDLSTIEEAEIPLAKTVSQGGYSKEYLKPEEDFGMSSIYSKSSVETESSVSCLSAFKSILKSSALKDEHRSKRVTFDL